MSAEQEGSGGPSLSRKKFIQFAEPLLTVVSERVNDFDTAGFGI